MVTVRSLADSACWLRWSLSIAALLLATGGAAAQAPRDQAVVYRLGAKDLVEVQVVEEPSLNLERRVNDTGTLILPLIGEVSVAGLTTSEVAAVIRQRLEESYLQRATATVRVIEYRSRPISVIGGVRRPGTLELSGRWNLLDALTDAGGLVDGHGDDVHILRRAENGLSDRLTISLTDLLDRADPTVNIPIFSHDVITVGEATPLTIYLMGEVGATGAMDFATHQQPTLLTAIARAGGLSERASNKITVKRLRDDGTRYEIKINYKRLLSGEQPDLTLANGDLILVKESFL